LSAINNIKNVSKRSEITREWRKLHTEGLHDLCPSPNIIRVIKSGIMRWAVYVARMGGMSDAYRVSVGKPETKRSLGILRCR
jgi:hypothetical protein